MGLSRLKHRNSTTWQASSFVGWREPMNGLSGGWGFGMLGRVWKCLRSSRMSFKPSSLRNANDGGEIPSNWGCRVNLTLFFGILEHSQHCSAVLRHIWIASLVLPIANLFFFFISLPEETSERFVEQRTKRPASSMQRSSWGVGDEPLAGWSRFSTRSRCWCWAPTRSRSWSSTLFTRHATSSFSSWRCKKLNWTKEKLIKLQSPH